ncbi:MULTISPECIES: glycine cleavage system protein GcvH [Curvivirga]|uniref:glycine cleavage system protein GcvH n=1 Tax=Curvivirga TaxID=2856846 RepID=UPI0012BD200C|nr:glycine cleavage system protein GcvH [Curvivirga aplysinae]MTI09970.1 glycine cleavage system protein GcvH [Curvivirga aplysinae]
MSTIRYSEDHEWVSVDNGVATIGITDFAQKALGDVVFVELPETGDTVSQGGETGVVESVKAASEIYAPVSGEVVEINEELEANPGLVNEDAEGDAWFFKIKLSAESELEELMSADDYKNFTEESE